MHKKTGATKLTFLSDAGPQFTPSRKPHLSASSWLGVLCVSVVKFPIRVLCTKRFRLRKMSMRPHSLRTDRKHLLWTLLKLAALWIVLLGLPFIERTLLGSRTYYFLFIGLGLVFVLYGLTIRTIFHFLLHSGREPVYVWIAFLLWSVFICSILAVFGFEYDLLPKTSQPSITQSRPLIDYLYYEIITFTTVGYGDIVPTTAQGKVLAICTALLGATHGVTFVSIILQALSQPSSKGQE